MIVVNYMLAYMEAISSNIILYVKALVYLF